MMSKAGERNERSKVRIWAIRVVEMSAPMTTASAIVRGMRLFLTKEMSRSAVAVELCKRAVTPMPEAQAIKRFCVPRVINLRMDVP